MVYVFGTYILPVVAEVPYVSEISTLIDLLLIDFVVYQWFDGSRDTVYGIGWRFAILGILNSVFVHLWAQHLYLVAFFFSLLVASAVSTIYYSLSTRHAARTDLDTLVIHLPFSLWHAWSLVTVIISGFAAFTRGHNSSGQPGEVTTILVCLALAFMSATAWGYALQSKKGDIAGSLVLVWVLFGVYDEQIHHNTLIAYFALGCFIFAGVAAFKALWFTYQGNGSISLGVSERAPLIR
ncbi:hypothetical protein RQP46_001152 [Phenoliferia psychrophenolica]